MDTALSYLLYLPFEKGQLEAPPQNSKSLFWNTGYFSDTQNFSNIDVIENYKYLHDEWRGRDVSQIQEDDLQPSYDFILMHLPQQKDYTLSMMAQALNNLSEGGILIAMAANDAGGKKIDKFITNFGLIPNALSKSKHRIVWTKKQDISQDKINEYITKGARQKIIVGDHEFTTQAGVYGWNKIDQGSQILVDVLPHDLTGKCADFGCGYGFISQQVLKDNMSITDFYALDADYNALECAKENLKLYTDKCDVHYPWCDLTQPQSDLSNLDFIVMNPPFHQGKAMENKIGLDFISTAHKALKKSGTLYMVANIHLPYEAHIHRLFSKREILVEKNGYKVFKLEK